MAMNNHFPFKCHELANRRGQDMTDLRWERGLAIRRQRRRRQVLVACCRRCGDVESATQRSVARRRVPSCLRACVATYFEGVVVCVIRRHWNQLAGSARCVRRLKMRPLSTIFLVVAGILSGLVVLWGAYIISWQFTASAPDSPYFVIGLVPLALGLTGLIATLLLSYRLRHSSR
jgi:hypothetical protein